MTGIAPKLDRFEPESLEYTVCGFVDRHAVTRYTESEKPTGSGQVDKVDAIGAELRCQLSMESADLEALGTQVCKIPVRSSLIVPASAGPEKHQ